MKTILATLAIVFTLFAALPIYAGPSSGVAARIVFAEAPLPSLTWTPIVTSTVKGVKGISIANSGSLPLEVGIAFASASAEAEVRQMIVPAALSSVGAPGAIYYPLAVGYGARVSVRALSSTGAILSNGVMDMSLFYN